MKQDNTEMIDILNKEWDILFVAKTDILVAVFVKPEAKYALLKLMPELNDCLVLQNGVFCAVQDTIMSADKAWFYAEQVSKVLPNMKVVSGGNVRPNSDITMVECERIDDGNEFVLLQKRASLCKCGSGSKYKMCCGK